MDSDIYHTDQKKYSNVCQLEMCNNDLNEETFQMKYGTFSVSVKMNLDLFLENDFGKNQHFTLSNFTNIFYF